MGSFLWGLFLYLKIGYVLIGFAFVCFAGCFHCSALLHSNLMTLYTSVCFSELNTVSIFLFKRLAGFGFTNTFN